MDLQQRVIEIRIRNGCGVDRSEKKGSRCQTKWAAGCRGYAGVVVAAYPFTFNQIVIAMQLINIASDKGQAVLPFR